MSGKKKQLYFVLHTGPDRPRTNWDPTRPYEIQILDGDLRAELVGYVGMEETGLLIEDQVVSQAVLDAARRQPVEQGEYVNEEGEVVNPLWWIPPNAYKRNESEKEPA